MKRIIDFLLPPRCVSCGIETLTTPGLCAACWEKIHFIEHPLCDKCGRPFEIAEITHAMCLGCFEEMPKFHRLRSVFPYDEGSKSLVLKFKHGDALHLTPLFVQWLAQAGRSLLTQCDVIIPIPLHWRRLWMRSYNQAAILAQSLSKIYAKKYDPCVLHRRRSTPSQGTKTSQQRHDNVKGSFALRASQVKNLEKKNILLIDDVYASGATVLECVKILKKSGANQIDVLTLARVL